jgi:DNA-binding NarL/FixJ family response regulator
VTLPAATSKMPPKTQKAIRQPRVRPPPQLAQNSSLGELGRNPEPARLAIVSLDVIRVAIVEENKTVREGLETIVNLASGCRCVGAWGTAEEALPMLWRQEPEVVLMDAQLPDMPGVECTAQIKKRLPAVQIILLTVYEDPDRIFHALRAGACGYLLKRSTPEQIIAAIRGVQQAGTASCRQEALGSENSSLGERGRSANTVTLAGES